MSNSNALASQLVSKPIEANKENSKDSAIGDDITSKQPDLMKDLEGIKKQVGEGKENKFTNIVNNPSLNDKNTGLTR